MKRSTIQGHVGLRAVWYGNISETMQDWVMVNTDLFCFTRFTIQLNSPMQLTLNCKILQYYNVS